MKNIDEIIKLIDSKEYITAIDKIGQLKKPEDSYLNYLLGFIYQQYDNPEKSVEKAEEYFGKVIESEKPIPDAFNKLAQLKKNREQSLRILQKGLNLFPNDVELYESLLKKNHNTERIKIFYEIDEKGISSKEITLIKIETFFDVGDYKTVLQLLDNIEIESEKENLIKQLIKGYCLYEQKDYTKAFAIFNEIIKEDIKNNMQYSAHIGAIISSANYDNAQCEKYFEELPESLEIDTYIFFPYSSFVFDFTKYVENLFSTLIKNNETKIKSKIRGLRGLFKYSNPNKKINYASILKDLLAAHKQFPYSEKYIENIIWLNLELNDVVEAFKFCIKYCDISFTEEPLHYSKWDFIESLKGDVLKEVTNMLYNKFENGEIRANSLFIKEVFSPLVEANFKANDFNQVLRLQSYFSKKELIKSTVLFEIAYSYSEKSNLNAAEEYYNLYIDKNGITSSVSNNIGVIYEKKGLLEKAKINFEKAIELDKNDEIAANNLKRIIKLLNQDKKENLDLKTALEEFKNENPWIKNKVLQFSTYKDSEGFIICPYRQLPQYLSVSALKSADLIKTFLNQKYLIKVSEHNLNTTSSVYRINPFLEQYLSDIQNELKYEEDLLLIAEKLNTHHISEIGFNDELIKAISHISDDELRDMILRDVKEDAISLITHSYKSTIVLSGSIIESVLLFYVKDKGISSYKMKNGKNKKVSTMDLNELLDLSKEEKYIEDHIYHLAHAIRGYRNLIHPGVEQRKKSLKVNYDNAKLSWDITRKILLELF